MEKNFILPRKMVPAAIILTAIGLAAVIAGLLSDPSRTWSNILFSNFFFLTISIGALLFYSIQYITGSEWSVIIQRIPLSLGAYLPVAAIVMLLMYFGLPQVYEWAHPGITQTDEVIAHKSAFLNVPFFMTRILIYFGLWISLAMVLFRLAVQEDRNPGQYYYEKSAFYAKAFIFAAAILFSFAAVDWIMTIDAHWYSTLFGFRIMVTSIYFAVAAIVLILLFLRSMGYLPQLREAHRHDLARYLFRFSIVYGYLWFMQFLIIWYANIPETVIYYKPRFQGEWQPLFYADLFLNFVIPFVVLMSDNLGRRKPVLFTISSLLIIGLWVSLFQQIMPGSYGPLRIGFIEVGMWLGFLGIFLLLTFYSLSRMALVPVNHPLIGSSVHHHL
ncbi:MAG: hypothetical protein R6U64_01735 [Bacteroidales bacterium]